MSHRPVANPPGNSPGRLLAFFHSFLDLLHLPRAFWFIQAVFLLDNMAYFGVLTLMATYLSTDMAWGDTPAHWAVGIFTGMVTLFMLGVGSYAEGFGLRRALIFALFISIGGRALYSYAYEVPGAFKAIMAVFFSLVIMAVAAGIIQPVCYSGVKQYTDEKTNAMGYGLLYALMNLGIVFVGAISAWVRPGVDRLIANDLNLERPLDTLLVPLARTKESGVQAVNLVCAGISMIAFLFFILTMTRRAESAKTRPDTAEQNRAAATESIATRLYKYFAGGPFTNARFVFFIFMLLPVRTLFAHQWLTMPQYILRAYPQGISDYMEWLVNWINPLIIFVGVPIVTALTKHVHVYRMMMIGTLVSAVPIFLLVPGPNLGMLIAYFVVFSIGECLWSARFYEYTSEIAPPGRIAQYMGLANIPWLLAKTTTGFYSGYVLATYCPQNVLPEAQNQTGGMWILYGCIAMTTPLGLWAARKWVMRGLQMKQE